MTEFSFLGGVSTPLIAVENPPWPLTFYSQGRRCWSVSCRM